MGFKSWTTQKYRQADAIYGGLLPGAKSPKDAWVGDVGRGAVKVAHSVGRFPVWSTRNFELGAENLGQGIQKFTRGVGQGAGDLVQYPLMGAANGVGYTLYTVPTAAGAGAANLGTGAGQGIGGLAAGTGQGVGTGLAGAISGLGQGIGSGLKDTGQGAGAGGMGLLLPGLLIGGGVLAFLLLRPQGRRA